ncbi:MAG: roadblock/LC7 domain-containing protein, partial [Verrucomicrobiota bacterium]
MKSVLEQLANGRVRISLGELKQAAPPSVFSDTADQNQTLIDLPLSEILPRLKPAQLPRRTEQKRVNISDEIAPLFGPLGKSPLSAPGYRTPEPASPPASPAPIASALSEKSDADKTGLVVTARENENKSSSAIPLARPTAIEPQPPLPATATTSPALQSADALKPVAATVPLHRDETTAAREEKSSDELCVAVSAVRNAWPPDLQNALSNIGDASLFIPMDQLEAGLRRGRIQFPWATIQSWIRPSLGASKFPENTMVELPLAAIAPLFLARRKPAPLARKVVVSENIPALFSPKARPAEEEIQQSEASAVAEEKEQATISAPQEAKAQTIVESPAPSSVPAPSPKVEALAVAPAEPVQPMPTAAAAPLQTAPTTPPPSAPQSTPAAQPSAVRMPVLDYGEIFGIASKRDWSPNEIVQHTANLRGLAGALLATTDGLLVASALPPNLNGETVAAFVPQMYGRISQYARELKFNDPGHVTVLIENSPLQIFRTGNLYFTVLGRSGEALPR